MQAEAHLLRPCKVYRVADPFEEVVLSGKSDTVASTTTVLRMVTFNVMMDRWKGEPYMTTVACHEERYAFIVAELCRLDADVVMLNEVTTGFLRCARSLTSYVASGSPDHENGGPNAASGMGNLVLVHRRLALLRMFSVALPRVDRLAVGAQIDLGDGRQVTVVSAHLSALTGNVKRRATQLSALAEALQDLDCVVVAGDLNWHVRAEEQHAPPGFHVAGNAEITFDGRINAMHQHLWPLGFEARQMALDRVLTRGAVEARDVEVIFNKSLYGDAAAESPPSPLGLFDKLWQLPMRALEQTGLVGAGAKENYLFPSDHFGLACKLALL
jgi:endonuclease/exonuclease/phosphatase family metal-dependent hydrolase